MKMADPATCKNLRLIALKASPFSERCKFALHVAGLLDSMAIIDYTPMVDEPWLRWMVGNWRPSATVSVPVIVFDDGSTLSDSIEIGKWAAKHSNGKLKVPPSEVLTRILALADKIMDNGRFKALTRGAASGAYDIEDIPPPLCYLPAPVIKQSFLQVGRYLLWKYCKGRNMTMESATDAMRSALKELDEMRVKNGGAFMYGDEFSLADIIVCNVLSFGAPLPNGFSRIGPNMSKDWTEAELAQEFANMIEWRNNIYRERRGVFKQREGRASL